METRVKSTNSAHYTAPRQPPSSLEIEHHPQSGINPLFHCPEEASGLSMALCRELGLRRLDAELHTLLDAQIAACRSIWEVVATTPGGGLQLDDRLTGAERFVSDTRTSQDVVPLAVR